MSLLVRTPSPYPDESLLGYVLRVSERNGYETLWHVFAAAGVPQGRMSSAGVDIAKLAAVMGKSRDDLAPLSYRLAVGDTSMGCLAGHPLALRDMRLSAPRICPACVHDEGFIQAQFDLWHFVACPIHRVWLQTSCPACGSKLSWFRPGLLTCKCGANWDGLELHLAPNHVIDLMAVLAATVQRQPFAALQRGLPPELARMSLRALLHTLTVLGRDWEAGTTVRLSPETVITAAAEALHDWPQGYFRALEGFAASADQEAYGLRKQFERLYSSLFKFQLAPAAEFEFLRSAFLEFGVAHWGRGFLDAKLFRGQIPLTDRRFLSQTELARHLGVQNSTARRLVRAGHVDAKEVVRNGKARTLTDVTKLSLVSGSDGRSFGVRKAAEHIGLPVSVLKSLRTSGHYEVKHMASRLAAFHEADLNAFVAKVMAWARPPDGIEPTVQTIAIDDVMRLKFKSQEGKADFIRAALGGNIEVLALGATGIGTLVIPETAADRFLQDSRAEAFGGTRTPTAVAKVLHCDSMCIPIMVEMGLLEGIRTAAGLRIYQASVECFSAEYVSLAAVAKKYRTSSRRLIRLANERGIPLLEVPRGEDGIPQPFLRPAVLDGISTLVSLCTDTGASQPRSLGGRRVDLI